MAATQSAPRTSQERRKTLPRFVAESVAVLVGVGLAVFGALAVPLLAAFGLTPVLTGWRDPGPEIIQGCEKNLMCAESGTFYLVWGLAFLAYVVAVLLIFRAVLNRLASRQRRNRG